MKIHKNFLYLELSHIKYSSALLKQEMCKNRGPGKSFNYLIAIGAFTLIILKLDARGCNFSKTTKYLPHCLISYYFDDNG